MASVKNYPSIIAYIGGEVNAGSPFSISSTKLGTVTGARHFLSACKSPDKSFPALILVPKLLGKCLAPDFSLQLPGAKKPVACWEAMCYNKT
jgi:hypothetical protein